MFEVLNHHKRSLKCSLTLDWNSDAFSHPRKAEGRPEIDRVLSVAEGLGLKQFKPCIFGDE